MSGNFENALTGLIRGLVRLKPGSREVADLLGDWDRERGDDWFVERKNAEVSDQTFHRTLVTYDGLHYNHPEKGGPDRDPVQAMLTRNVDQHLGKTMEFARKTHPQCDWVYARLLVQVVPFDPQPVVERLIRDRIREQALRKLTTEEREALGL